MFRFNHHLTEIIRSGSQMFVVCLVGVWQRNFEPVMCVCTVRRAGSQQITLSAPLLDKLATTKNTVCIKVFYLPTDAQ